MVEKKDAYDMGKRGELGCQSLVKGDEGSLVANLVTVVRGREDRDALSIVFNHVTLVLDLVTADEEIQTVLLQEVLRDVGSKLSAHSTLAG